MTPAIATALEIADFPNLSYKITHDVLLLFALRTEHR